MSLVVYLLVAYGMTLVFVYKYTDLRLRHKEKITCEEMRVLPDPNREIELAIEHEKTKQRELTFKTSQR